ncbi:hypothetical protein BsWGS_11886 [Bradybaena similaris]
MWTVDISGLLFVGSGADGNTTIEAQNTFKTSKCWLVADKKFRDQLSVYLREKSKLIEMTINLRGHPEDRYNPYIWIRSTSRQGRSLLTLGDDYKYKSMMTLSIGVVSLQIDVSDLPTRCMRGRDPEETLNIIRLSFFRNFIGPLGENKSTFGAEEHLCNMQIFRKEEFEKTQYRCCQLDSGGHMDCHDLTEDEWIDILLILINIIKFLTILYSPLFLPECLYRQKYEAGKYIYHVPRVPITLKVAVTQNPDQIGVVNRQKTVSELKSLEYVKALSKDHSNRDKLYEINVQKVLFSVESRRLLDGVSVPVTLTTMLYNNLLRCRLKRLEPLKECCASRILGKLKPDFKCITWHQCLTRFAQSFLLILLATPWIIHVVLNFAYPAAVFENNKRMAKETDFITLIHVFFYIIIIIITIIIDCILLFVNSSSKEEALKFTRQCLSDTKERSRYVMVR